MAKNAKIDKTYTNLYVKRRLIKLEIDVFDIISKGILNHVPKSQILSQIKLLIRDISVQIGLSAAESNWFWNQSVVWYNDISKKTFRIMRKTEPGKDDEARSAAIYASIRAKIQKNDLLHQANQVMYSYEFRHKHDSIYGTNGMIANAREDSKSPFFLCSAHPKPAKDHAGWEGKMYYDEEWQNYVPDDQASACRAYIRNHQLRSVQWVVGEPVYLVTRRNCKHYLKNIPIQEVLHSSAKALLKKHNMVMPEEVPVPRDVLEYREYYSRLKVEESLNKLIPNKKLEQDLKKDRKILNKYLTKLKK